MTIDERDSRSVYQRSGNRCADPHCTKSLIDPDSPPDEPIPISEIAHIVGQQLDGPRGHDPLPLDERDKYDNLLLLCEEHHHLVDALPQEYTVEVLRQMKTAHEQLMDQATQQAVDTRQATQEKREYVQETLYSTLLPVLRMPRHVYGASCKYNDRQAKKAAEQVVFPKDPGEMYPFIIRNGMIFSFHDMSEHAHPFVNLLSEQECERYLSTEWWADRGYRRWYIELLNRSLHT